jgi:hypothetical protein
MEIMDEGRNEGGKGKDEGKRIPHGQLFPLEFMVMCLFISK